MNNEQTKFDVFLTSSIQTSIDLNEISFLSSNSDELVFIPESTPIVKKKSVNVGMIVGIVCGIIAVIVISVIAVIVVLKRRENGGENSIKEDQSKNSTFIDDKINNKTHTEFSLEIDDEDRDLNFWI